MSKYGLSKIEGTSVKEVTTQFDNISSITVSEAIRNELLSSGGVNNVKLGRYDRYIYLHISEVITFKLDTLTGLWCRMSGRYCNEFISAHDKLYSLYNGVLMQWEVGYRLYNPLTGIPASEVSYYTLGWNDLDDQTYSKNISRLLISGTTGTPSSGVAYIVAKLYKDHLDTLIQTITHTLSSIIRKTWANIASTYASWTLAKASTLPYASLSNDSSNRFTKVQYRLGYYKNIRIRLEHSYDASILINQIDIDFDTIYQRDIN
jgi:hypothetical protein